MKVEYKLINNVFRPRVVAEESSQTQVLNCLLEDAENSLPIYLELVESAKKGQETLGEASNQVGVDFFSGKMTVEHLWTNDENEEPLYIEMTLDEAEQLFLNLQKAKQNLKMA